MLIIKQTGSVIGCNVSLEHKDVAYIAVVMNSESRRIKNTKDYLNSEWDTKEFNTGLHGLLN